MKKYRLLAVPIGLAGWLALGGAAQAQTCDVIIPDGDATSAIQTAITGLSGTPDQTICVGEGVYTGDLVIDVPGTTIIGKGCGKTTILTTTLSPGPYSRRWSA